MAGRFYVVGSCWDNPDPMKRIKVWEPTGNRDTLEDGIEAARQHYLANYGGGEKVVLKVYRNDRDAIVEVAAGEEPSRCIGIYKIAEMHWAQGPGA
jgi:hypothetical protein